MVSLAEKLNKKHVLVFATDLMSRYDVQKVTRQLNKIDSILRWTVDLFDWERVLRVEVQNLKSAQEIKTILRSRGYQCEDLNH
ncbi:MAG: hypothetical protein AAF551_08810 [Bacteroidota bacterium]